MAAHLCWAKPRSEFRELEKNRFVLLVETIDGVRGGGNSAVRLHLAVEIGAGNGVGDGFGDGFGVDIEADPFDDVLPG